MYKELKTYEYICDHCNKSIIIKDIKEQELKLPMHWGRVSYAQRGEHWAHYTHLELCYKCFSSFVPPDGVYDFLKESYKDKELVLEECLVLNKEQ